MAILPKPNVYDKDNKNAEEQRLKCLFLFYS